MKLGHLHIHTRDRARSTRFYGDWFGMRIQRQGEALSFLTDEHGFELALMDDTSPTTMPSWFHFGFHLDSKDAVLDLYRRMTGAAVEMRKGLYEDETLVSFRCLDPDGYAIEIYWESEAAGLEPC